MSAGGMAPVLFDRGLLVRLARLSAADRLAVLRALPEPELRAFHESWAIWAMPGQREPEADWHVWLIRAGRGFGKTRAGAEWVSAVARATPGARIAMVGGTADDVRKVMVEGESGLIAVAQAGETYRWRRDAGEFVFDSGARAFVYSAEAPEKLRGPEHHAAWCDELAKWRYGDATWDNLMMGLRIGDRPRVLVTTTPRPVPLMRRLLALPDLYESRGGMGENPFLPASFVAAITATYEGTRLGRQELDGELIDDVEGALWTRDLLERQRCGVEFALPVLVRVVVGVDPPAGTSGDACGIVCVALGADDLAYVLEDASVSGLSPEGWARAVADCAARHGADRVVAECNQGGEMVRSVLLAADCGLPVRLVHASRGKVARAEPVATLYEGRRVFHAGAFPALEDELCGLVSGGYVGPGRSPDRADALVWALTELCLRRRVKVGVRVV